MYVLSKQAGNVCMPPRNHHAVLGPAAVEAATPGWAGKERDDYHTMLFAGLIPYSHSCTISYFLPGSAVVNFTI